ncbi:N-acetyl-gamma-glutamyl-phosphate reductase, partial [bacterium]
KIRKADFIANPGCYPTAALLALMPLLKAGDFSVKDIIIDAKSGYSGAGRKPADDPFWQELKDNFRAYKVDAHQHTPEINQELSKAAGKKISATFVPHLLPIERGILETIYVRVTGNGLRVTGKNLINLYKKFYKDTPFMRIRDDGEFPGLSDVQHTNMCDIGIKVSQDRKMIIILSAIDNLLKGASGQAVQNMNLMIGFKETDGLL